MSDQYNLQRFVDAQDAHPYPSVFDRACIELRNGRKESHWMWFIFPQLDGLGRSPTARKFAISSLGEARAYLEHPVLGPRLRECCRLVIDIEGRTIFDVLGTPDDLKFRSSVTLFASATSDNAVFLKALDKYWNGEGDEATLRLLRR